MEGNLRGSTTLLRSSTCYIYLFPVHSLTRLGNSGNFLVFHFADVAIGSPFGGEDKKGRVFIYNGNTNGLNKDPSQILEGSWASSSLPAGFGFTLRGDSDIDKNDYPGML